VTKEHDRSQRRATSYRVRQRKIDSRSIEEPVVTGKTAQTAQTARLAVTRRRVFNRAFYSPLYYHETYTSVMERVRERARAQSHQRSTTKANLSKTTLHKPATNQPCIGSTTSRYREPARYQRVVAFYSLDCNLHRTYRRCHVRERASCDVFSLSLAPRSASVPAREQWSERCACESNG